ncbi:hypothetical protein PM082_011296 [Marasmius tenuissimus]|nr:hypothetical protein PM082_011296 [Marasmius tenuissimus]
MTPTWHHLSAADTVKTQDHHLAPPLCTPIFACACKRRENHLSRSTSSPSEIIIHERRKRMKFGLGAKCCSFEDGKDGWWRSTELGDIKPVSRAFRSGNNERKQPGTR